MTNDLRSYMQQVGDLAYEALKRRLARQIEYTTPAQGERIEIPTMSETKKKIKVVYKGIETHAFRSDDIHTLMDMTDAQIKSIHVSPESTGYVDYLQKLHDKLTALWLELRPGEEAICSIRETDKS